MQIDECPVKATIDVIGGKWKPLILFELKNGKRRFGELLRSVMGVRHKVLTEQLKQLEADGIIQRQEYNEVILRTEYSLTEYGESLRPLLQMMAEWGIKHRAKRAETLS